MTKITKEFLINQALEKYSENQINNAYHCNVKVTNKDWISWELNLPLNNRGKKTKTQKIKSNIRSFLLNIKPDESNKRYNWDTSSENIESIEIKLSYKIDDLWFNIKKNWRNAYESISFTDWNIITLIWENGSWKSTILESVLENGLYLDNWLFISYSSWLNESFSDILKPYINKNRKITISWIDDYKNDEILNWFYFNKSRVWVLIFLAYSLKNKWKVKEFFREEKNEYLISETEPFIQFNIKIDKYYIEKLNIWTWEHKSLETTDFHNMLDKLLNNLSLWTLWTNKKWEKSWWISEKRSYDFEKPKKLTSMVLKSDDVKDIFWNNWRKILYYLWLLTNNNYFIDVNDIKLYFSKWISLNNLSDWEFQLLMVYALIDLFDSDETIYLFDEIDSHLHYKNINKLWKILKNEVKGKIITTTHIPDSIINNDIKSIKLVENWIINWDKTIKWILDRLDTLSDKEIYEMRLLRKVENFVLIDDDVDWIIFKKLVNKKLWVEAFNKLSDITYIKRSSSRDTTNEILWKWKFLYVDDFFKVNKWKEIKTKNIFLICDRDCTPLNDIKTDLQVNIPRDYSNLKTKWNTKTHLLSWKRLEIENYLLYKELLIQNGKFPHYNYNELSNLDWKEDVATLDCKDITHPLYKDWWFDEKKLDELIKKIPQEEISEDIEKMYDFIVSKLK